MIGTGRFGWHGWQMMLVVLTMATLLSGGGIIFGLPQMRQQTTTSEWHTFRDPLLGFSVNYPAAWQITTDQNGSHASFIDAASGTVISPVAQVTQQTASQVMARVPSGATDLRLRTIHGYQAVDFALPSIPQPTTDPFAATAHQRGRMLLLAQPNTAGTTNVFMLLLTQTMDAVHPVGAQLMTGADSTFDGMASSFVPPASRQPAQESGLADPDQATGTTMRVCDMVCWADANWNFGNYWDTYTVPEGGWQPYFGCTPFIARALTKSGLMPGLQEGGVHGGGSPSPDWAALAYGNYPIRFGNNTSATQYNLNWTGTRGSTGTGGQLYPEDGLYEYLVDSGIGQPIGENVWEAKPGDIVFLDRSHQPGPGYRHHLMIITSIFYDGWTGHGAYPTRGYEALLDGHNAAAYHDRMASWVEPYFGFPSFEIVHIRGLRHDIFVTPYLNYTGSWRSGMDSVNVPMIYTGTTTKWGATTRWAKYTISAPTTCGIDIYVPATHATAHPMYIVIKTSDGRWWPRTVYETSTPAFVFLYTKDHLSRPPVEVAAANMDGSNSHQLGLGNYVYFYC